MNESGVSYKPPHPPAHQHQQHGNNGSFVDNARDRSGERMPPIGPPSTMSQDLRTSQLTNKTMERRSNLSQNNIAQDHHLLNIQWKEATLHMQVHHLQLFKWLNLLQ